MYKEVLRSISGVEFFPTLSLLLFVLAAVLIVFWTFGMDKDEVKRMSRLPLSDSTFSEGEEV